MLKHKHNSADPGKDTFETWQTFIALILLST